MLDSFVEATPPTIFQVIGWWELRRVVCNVVLIVAVIATWLGIAAVAGPHLAPGEDPVEPMVLVFFLPRYFAVANACYTLGWIIELISRRFNPEAARRNSTWVFRGYLILACIVTSVPFWIVCAHWLL